MFLTRAQLEDFGKEIPMKRFVLAAAATLLAVVGLSTTASAADDWHDGGHYVDHHVVDHGWYADVHHEVHHAPTWGSGFYGYGQSYYYSPRVYRGSYSHHGYGDDYRGNGHGYSYRGHGRSHHRHHHH